MIILLSLIGGFILGFMFFVSLYWSIRKMGDMEKPSMFMVSTSLLRMVVLLVGFYFISGNDGRRFLAALLGSVIAKFAIIYFFKNRN